MLHLRRRKDSEKGQILVLFTLVLVVILAFASMVVDLGLLRNNRQTLVNAFDSAALAGGTTLPVDGSVAGAATATNNLIVSTITANYPGLPASAYTISYKCLIGVDTSTPPKPYISRDVPLVCDPHFSLGHNPPVAADFIGSGPTRYSSCNPAVGDKCNAVVIAGAANTPFTFGRVVGVNQGSTGVVVSAACNGPCGTSPLTPVDVVLVIDRTGSMSGTDTTNAKAAANSLVSIYNPSNQWLALGHHRAGGHFGRLHGRSGRLARDRDGPGRPATLGPARPERDRLRRSARPTPTSRRPSAATRTPAPVPT